MPTFPFGSDFTDVEQRLLPALHWLQQTGCTWRGKARLLAAACHAGAPAKGEREALIRMGLAVPRTFTDRVQRRLLQVALRRKPQHDERRGVVLDSVSATRA